MFGKVMSLPDALMESYYPLLTDIPPEEFRALIATKPRDAKVRLARTIVAWLHDRNAADAAEAEFVRVTHGELPDDIPTHHVGPGPHKLAPLLVKAGLRAVEQRGDPEDQGGGGERGRREVDGLRQGDHRREARAGEVRKERAVRDIRAVNRPRLARPLRNPLQLLQARRSHGQGRRSGRKVKQAKGKGNDVMGAIKGDTSQQIKGKVQKAVGKVQAKLGGADKR